LEAAAKLLGYTTTELELAATGISQNGTMLRCVQAINTVKFSTPEVLAELNTPEAYRSHWAQFTDSPQITTEEHSDQ
jgi:hypothetical protein